MRAVVQRVTEASVEVDGRITGAIEQGLLVFLGIEPDDTPADVDYVADKIAGLRCFADAESKFNLSLHDVGGSVLLVSQFTLLGDCRKGRRPSFTGAAGPDIAIPLYEAAANAFEDRGVRVETGEFGAHMNVRLANDGPVTLLIDSKKRF